MPLNYMRLKVEEGGNVATGNFQTFSCLKHVHILVQTPGLHSGVGFL